MLFYRECSAYPQQKTIVEIVLYGFVLLGGAAGGDIFAFLLYEISNLRTYIGKKAGAPAEIHVRY